MVKRFIDGKGSEHRKADNVDRYWLFGSETGMLNGGIHDLMGTYGNVPDVPDGVEWAHVYDVAAKGILLEVRYGETDWKRPSEYD